MNKTTIACVVCATRKDNGSPVLMPVEVTCAQPEIDSKIHYQLAADAVNQVGYESHFVLDEWDDGIVHEIHDTSDLPIICAP